MKSAILISSLVAASQVSASWFGSDPEYKSWDAKKLDAWLKEHQITTPKGYSKEELEALVESNWYAGQAWTAKQIEDAKSSYETVKDKSFDSWSESEIRQFLVDQGVVAPSGPREQLVLAAKKQYWAFSSAASSASVAASTAVYGNAAQQATKSAASAASVASKSATSAASVASASASSAGKQGSKSASSAANWGTKSVSSAAAQATDKAAEATAYAQAVLSDAADAASAKLDDTKDYVYSTWSDNELRSYLEEKGVIKTKTEATRDELLAKMKGAYAATTEPVWQAWSDSYLFNWLHARGLVRTGAEKKRDELVKSAQSYYYGAQDKAYSNWTESELREWLIEHGIIKSDAQVKKEKLQKLVADNYAQAQSTIWGGWKDSDIRDWLIEHGYLRSDAQVKRDELVKLASEKYNDVTASTAAYLTWPDARLRAFLRANGVDDRYLPATRPGLLQETRVRWVQSQNTVEHLIQQLRDTVGGLYENAEASVNGILESLTGTGDAAQKKGEQYVKQAEASASSVAAAAAKKTASLKQEL